jgi:hypothetical protein
MGYAERANAKAWRNRNPEEKAEGIRSRMAKNERIARARDAYRSMVSEYRKRMAAARGVNEARQEKKEAAEG